MPIYEYRCDDGHTVERTKLVAWAKCFCGKRAKRVYSLKAIHFKGNGFYHTDYKRGSGTPNKVDNSSGSESKPGAAPNVSLDKKKAT